MATTFIGQIMIAGFNFPPYGWASCDGSLASVDQNAVLFFLIGTSFGGDGVTTFGLPDMRGRAPMHFGTGGGMTTTYAQKGGTESVTLLTTEMPAHTHTAQAPQSCSTGPGISNDPAGRFPGISQRPLYTENSTGSLAAGSAASSSAGLGQAHENSQPYLTMNFVIALNGIFPQRN